MFGIQFLVRRVEDNGMVKDEVIYLRTHRRGAAGDRMRDLIKQYRHLGMEQSKANARAVMPLASVGMLTSGEDHTEKLCEILTEQDAAMRAAEAAGAEALKVAEQIAVCALEDNYGDQGDGTARNLDAIVDGLTDHELHGIVATIELGSMPKDFFPSPATPQKQSNTSASGT